MSYSYKYRNCKSKLESVYNNRSKNNFLNYTTNRDRLYDAYNELSSYDDSDDYYKCEELYNTAEKLYDINDYVKSCSSSSDVSYYKDRVHYIYNQSGGGTKEEQLAQSVENELYCALRNNDGNSVSDYNYAYNNSKVSDLRNIYSQNESNAREKDIDTNNSNIVHKYSRSYSDLDTLRSLYYQSNNYSLKDSISNNYRSIFKYLIQSNNNSAISRSYNSEYDFDCSISDINNVISNYNRYYSDFSSSDYSIKNNLDQNLENLIQNKINFCIRKAREYLNNKSFSSAKSYIDIAYSTARNYSKSIYNIEEYRKKIYNAESDYYNSEGKNYFNNKDYVNAIYYYNRALNCLSSYRDTSLENNIRQNIKEVENTKKNIEANNLHKEGLDKYKEKNLANYDIIKSKFTSAHIKAIDGKLKQIIKKDIDKLETWKLNLSLEEIKKQIEKNEPTELENSLEKLKPLFNEHYQKEDPYKDIIESYINEILYTLFKYYSETTNKPLNEKIEKTKKIISEMKSFNNNNNFGLKFDEKDIKYYEGITYCLDAEQIRKKGDKDSYREAYIKYKEGLENGIACDDLVNHMQIWKKNMFEAFCKKCIESEDEDELEDFIKEYEPNEIGRLNELKSHLYASNAVDKLDNDNISKDEKKNIIENSLKKHPNNASMHQMNIALNNDSDESQKKAVQQALEHCPDDPEINHIASNVYQKSLSKDKNLTEEEKNNLNSFNNKLLKSNDEVLLNDGLNLINTQNEKKMILDKEVFNNLCSLQTSKNENTAIKASKLIVDNLNINNNVDINNDNNIKKIVNDGIKNENLQIQNNYLGLIAQKGNFENNEESKSIAEICENNIKDGINIDNSLTIINNISKNDKENNIKINNETTEKLFSNLNHTSANNDNNNTEKILSILKNTSTNIPKEQNDLYKENLPNLISNFPENEKSVGLLDNYISKNSEVTQEIVGSLYDGLNSEKPEIKEKYVSVIEKMDSKNIKEIPSDISNSLINILKNEKNPEVKKSIFNIFQKNSDKIELNENQENQIKTQELCDNIDNTLKENREDEILKKLDEIKNNINNYKTEEESFQNKLINIIELEGYDDKKIEILLLMINKDKPINNNLKKSICNKINNLLIKNENDKNNQNLIGYFYIINNLIKITYKNEEEYIVKLYTDLLNNINIYKNCLINPIISGSLVLLSKQKLKINDISNKLFEVYENNKNMGEDISILLSKLYSDNNDKINIEKIFKIIFDNKTNEIIIKNCCSLLAGEEQINELFKNKENQKDAIDIIKDSKFIPKEFIDIIDLIANKLPDLEELIKFNKYFIDIKKENNIEKNVSELLNYKNKDIKLNDEHISIIFSKFTKNETAKFIYKLLEIVPNESILNNFDSINKLINTDFFENIITILLDKKIQLSQEIIKFYIKKIDSNDEQEFNKTLAFLLEKIYDSLNQEQKNLIDILKIIKEENLINDKEKVKLLLEKISNNKIPNKRIASILGKIICETTDNSILKDIIINYYKNLSSNSQDASDISKKIFERIKKNLFENEDEKIQEETIQLLGSFDGMGIEFPPDFIDDLMKNNKLNLNNNQKLTASIIEFLLNLIKSKKLEFKTFYDTLCENEDIKKLFESLNLEIVSNKLNENIDKIREAIKDYSYYKYNLDQIILYSVIDKKEEDEEKFDSLYKDFENNKSYSIIDKYLFVKILFDAKNKYKYDLSQINDILYFIQKIPINIIFNLDKNIEIDFYKIFQLEWMKLLLNENGKKYIEDIISYLDENKSFNVENIERFLSHIEYDNDEQMLVEIIKSINNHNIKFNEFEDIFENGKKIKLRDLFNTIIDKIFEDIFENDEQEILNAKKIFKNADWNMETFRYMAKEKRFLFYSLENKNDKDIINKACEIICLFQLSNGNDIIDILKDIYENNPDKWEELWILELNKIASRKIMVESKKIDQPIENYLKEIFYCDEKKEKGKYYIEKENINKNKKLREYLILSEIKYNEYLEKRKDWDIIQCSNWISDNKNNLFNSNNGNKDFIPEIFAVFSILNKNIGLYHLKRIQLLSLLLLTSNYPNGGVFCEIGTGEGKSTIVEFLAAFLALSGKKVDIISSSPILAERDAKDENKIVFFEALGLTVGYSSNVNDKFRYEKQILYGDVLTNEGDILRNVYEKLDIRKGRQFDFIIIDEVDNLSLDNLSSKTQLVSSFPGKDYLYSFYFCILITLFQLDKDNTNKENKIEIVKQELLKSINDLYNKEKNKPEKEREIFYPEYLKGEIEKLIPCWVDSAITIFYHMKENKDFIINEKGEINPVDFSNTGIVQRNMVWENGMHQMLQILNILRIHPESTGTNYLSNVSYFKKYFKNNKSNIFGVTGTIGEISSQKILMDIYKVNIYFIPRAIKKQLRIYGAIISDNKQNWLNEIKGDAIRETRNGRAVLIICKSISITEELFELFKNEKKESTIKSIILYNKNDEEEENNNNDKNKKRIEDIENSGKRERKVTSVEFELYPGIIIISTNLAGRGTDIKLNDSIVENGGLHVIITFLPDNKRIEDQNYGRAARKGQPGTGRLIVNKMEEGFIEDDIREVKKIRAQNEYEMITKSMKTEVPKHIFEDELFDKFCKFLDEIVDNNTSNENLFKDNFNQSIKERSICIKKNTEEMWGEFIKKIQDTNINENEDFDKYKNNALIQFDNFKNDIKNKIQNKKIFRNPFLSYKRFGKIFYEGYGLDDYSKTEYESLLQSESYLAFGLQYNFAVYNAIGALNLTKAKEYYKKVLDNIDKFSNDFLEKIPVLNTFVIEQVNKKNIKRKIPIQKSFDNKKISFRSIHEMINQNLGKIEEYEQRIEKEDEIYLVRESDKSIKELLSSKTEIKDEEDLDELVQFYDDFGIGYLVVLKIRKETSLFTFFTVLFTGIVELAVGICLSFTPGCASFGLFLIQEGFKDIKDSINYIQGKIDINLGDWAKNKSIKFLTYVVTSLIPGLNQVADGLLKTKNLLGTIKDEVLGLASEFILKKALAELKNKFKKFIEENFIDKIFNLFDKFFDKIGKSLAFACNVIDSTKNYINDIVSSFKNLVNIIMNISTKIITLCKKIVSIIKGLKDVTVTKIPGFIKDAIETVNLFKFIAKNLECLPKLIQNIFDKFNLDNKVKNLVGKNIFCGDDEYKNLITNYNDNFESSKKNYQDLFENSLGDFKENMKKKFDIEINRKIKNLEVKMQR